MTIRRGLFLDLDGTLADSLAVMRAIYEQFLADHGAKGSDAEFQELNGPTLDRVVEILKLRYQIAAPTNDLLGRYLQILLDQYLQVRPNPGVPETLTLAKNRGWHCAVVTSSSEGLAQAWLKKTGLDSFITTIVGKESVKCGKPDPEPYLIALSRLGCQAQHSLAAEDTQAGINSATQAGLKVFGYKCVAGALPIGAIAISDFSEVQKWL